MFKKSGIILTGMLLFLAAVCFFPIAFNALAVSGVDIPTSASTGLTDRGIDDILGGILDWMLRVVGIVALIGFVVSGAQYILSAGDEKRMDAGKKNMTYSIIGIAIVLGSFVIIQAIDTMLEGAYSLW